MTMRSLIQRFVEKKTPVNVEVVALFLLCIWSFVHIGRPSFIVFIVVPLVVSGGRVITIAFQHFDERVMVYGIWGWPFVYTLLYCVNDLQIVAFIAILLLTQVVSPLVMCIYLKHLGALECDRFIFVAHGDPIRRNASTAIRLSVFALMAVFFVLTIRYIRMCNVSAVVAGLGCILFMGVLVRSMCGILLSGERGHE